MINSSSMTSGVLLGNKALAGDTSATLDTAQIYTDLNGIQQLKAQGKTDKAGALKNIAHQFESMMVQMMMKSMRDANAVFSEGDMTSSSDEKFYRDMFDNQLALSLSKGRGFGIAEALMRQLQGRVGAENSATTPAANTADTKSVDTKNVDTKNVDARNSFSVGSIPVQNGNSMMQRVKALVENTVASGAEVTESPRMIAAIQDAMHALFAETADHEAETNTTSAPVALDGTPSNFIDSLRPLARKAAAMLGVDTDVLLSQSALETGWGQKVLQCPDGSSSFNFFNIKAGSDWQGDVVKVPTIEYHNGVAVREWASFRAYGSPEESFADYARLISENPRYQQALECAENPRDYMKALANAGYATDPSYAQKVLAVLDSEHVQGTRPIQ